MSTLTKRCIGLELGGSKSSRTALAVFDYFPENQRIFLAETHSRIEGGKGTSGDEALIEIFARLRVPTDVIGVNAPLGFAPCAECTRSFCPGASRCDVPEVQWMRGEAERVRWPVAKRPTPYTQRAVDVALRTRVQPHFTLALPAEESLGSGRGPLAMRLRYLRRHVQSKVWLETAPRAALFALAGPFGLSQRELRLHREVEEGVEHRVNILEKLSQPRPGLPLLFLYERELLAAAADLDLFDAAMSGLMAAYQAAGLLAPPPEGYQEDWGWLAVPRFLVEGKGQER